MYNDALPNSTNSSTLNMSVTKWAVIEGDLDDFLLLSWVLADSTVPSLVVVNGLPCHCAQREMFLAIRTLADPAD